jgi:phenylacetate-CoA ligase
MTAELLEQYTEIINRYRPEKMCGYATAFYLLARQISENAWWPGPWLKLIVATGEPLFDFQRKLIQSVFGVPISVEYSSREAGLIANECPQGGLHIFAEGMYVEVLEAGSDGRGEIVISNLDSFTLPLIRFRTGDLGVLESSDCPCGRSLPRLTCVEERQTDFLVTPGGRVLHLASVIGVLREVPTIREFRVVQDAIDHVIVEMVPDPAFSADDHTTLLGQLRLLLGIETKVEVKRVSAIPRTRSGRLRYLESKVAAGQLQRLAPSGVSHRNAHEAGEWRMTR